MNGHTWPEDGFNRRVEDLMESLSGRLRDTVAYIDQVVVPEVRREAGGAARLLAGHLDRLAERLHPQPAPDGNRDL